MLRTTIGKSPVHRWHESAGRLKVAVVAAAAFLVVAVGAAEIVLVLRNGSTAQPLATANIDGVTAAVNRAVWIGMDMPGPTVGYQMPAGMMPGMPADGEERLSVTVTVVNTSGETRQVRVTDEFSLRGKDGKHWTPKSSTFGELPRLAPDNAVTGELYFDLPRADAEAFSGAVSGASAQLWVEWNYQGGLRALEIPPVGAGLTHDHE